MNADCNKNSNTAQTSSSTSNNSKPPEVEFYPERGPKLAANDYMALSLDDDKNCKIPEWQKKNAEELAEMQASRKYRYIDSEGEPNGVKKLDKCFTGIRCGDGGLVALDLDLRDKTLSAIAMRVLKAHLNLLDNPGTLIIREGLFPKKLVPVVVPQDDIRRKGTVEFKASKDEKKADHVIELLCKGSYFQESGIHPKTQKPYQYLTDDNFENTPISDLPKVSWDWIESLLDEISDEFAKLGYIRKNTGTMIADVRLRHEHGSEDDDLNNLFDDPLSAVTGYENMTMQELESVYGHEDFSELHYPETVVRCLEIQNSLRSDRKELRDWVINKTYSPTAANESNRTIDEVRKRVNGVFEKGGKRNVNAASLKNAYIRKAAHEAKVQRDESVSIIESFIEQLESAESVGEVHTICDSVKNHAALNDEQRWSLSDAINAAYKDSKIKPPLKAELQKLILVDGGNHQNIGNGNVVEKIIKFLDENGTYYISANQGATVDDNDAVDESGNPYVDIPVGDKREPFKPQEDGRFKHWLVAEGAKLGKRLTKADRDFVYDHIEQKAFYSGKTYPVAMRYWASPDGSKRLEDVGNRDGTVIETIAGVVRVIPPTEDSGVKFVRGDQSRAMHPFEYINPSELHQSMEENSWIFGTTPTHLHNVFWALLVTWSDPSTPNPILMSCGSSGSGKSTFVEIMMQIIDRQAVTQVGQSNSQRSLRAHLTGNYATAEQNGKPYSGHMLDDICVAYDNGSVKEAKLYKNGMSALLDVSGVLMFTGLDDTLPQKDMPRRKIVAESAPIPAKGKVGIREMRKRIEDTLPRLQNIRRALTAEVMRRESEPTNDQGLHDPAFIRVCNTIARIRGQSWTYQDMMHDSGAEELQRLAESDVLLNEIDLFAKSQASFSWGGLPSKLKKEIDEEYKGTIPAQMALRREDANYPTDNRKLSQRLQDPEFKAMAELKGLSIEVAATKSNGGRQISIRVENTAVAKAERDMDRSRKHGEIGTDLDSLMELDTIYTKEACRLFHEDVLRKYPPDHINQMSSEMLLELALKVGVFADI